MSNDVNKQHMEAMGLDPEDLGKPVPKEESERCEATMDNVRCARRPGHLGGHARGNVYWDEPRVADEAPDADEPIVREMLAEGHNPELGKATALCGLCEEPLLFDQPGDITTEMTQKVMGDHLRAKHPETLKQREGDQILPTTNDFSDVQSQVIADIESRRQVGISRYGTALQPFNGRKTLLDAYEEALDLTIYLRSLLTMQEAQRDLLVEVVQKALLNEWMGNVASSREDSPEGFTQSQAEIAVNVIIDALTNNLT